MAKQTRWQVTSVDDSIRDEDVYRALLAERGVKIPKNQTIQFDGVRVWTDRAKAQAFAEEMNRRTEHHYLVV